MTKFMMLRDIIALKDISAQQKLVLIAMNQYGDEGHNIYPAIETIAGMVSMSPRNTARHIHKLRGKGYLIATGKSRRNTINYRMVIPHDATVTRTMTPSSYSKGHQRLTTTRDNKPSNNMSVGRVSLFVPLIGPLGAIMAWAYLDTLITGVDVLAIAMVVFGVAVPTLSKNSTPKSR